MQENRAKPDTPMQRLEKFGKFSVSQGWDAEKEIMLNRQFGLCLGCCRSAAIELMDRDHIIARSKGGIDDISNLQLLCIPCNQLKQHYTMKQLADGLSKSWGSELHYHLRRKATEQYRTWVERYESVQKPMYDLKYHMLVELRDALPGWCRKWVVAKTRGVFSKAYDDSEYSGYTRVFTYAIGTPLHPEPDHKFYAGLLGS